MSKSQHSRRDFLRGRAAVAAAAEVVEAVIDSRLGGQPSPDAVRQGLRVLTLTRRAMACDFEIRICASPERNDTAAGMLALDCIERLEDQLTVYRDESELIDMNFAATGGPTPVEERLFGLLELCGKIYTETDRAFDPTSGPLSRVWGFHRRDGRIPEEDERLTALDSVGWEHVRLNASEKTVFYDHPELEINMNSIGKGYALDQAAEVLSEQNVEDSLLHGGRSTLLALGSNRLLQGGGWRAGIRDPLRPERRLAEFTLRDEALSTSGSGTQFFEHEGHRYGHLIDPRSGWPAEGLYSATVMAPTAAEADAFSTAAYILGVEGTADLCRRRPDVRALLLAPAPEASGAESEVAIHAFNLAPEEWHPQEST